MNPQRAILVVDDDCDMLDFCATALRLDGWRVETASASEQAEGLLKTVHFDVVLSDFSTTSQARSLTRAAKELQPGVEVVVMTGLPSLETALACFAEGARAYLVKPFHLDNLLAAVHACVQPGPDRTAPDEPENAWLRPVMRTFVRNARSNRELPRLPALLALDERLSKALYRMACEARREFAAA